MTLFNILELRARSRCDKVDEDKEKVNLKRWPKRTQKDTECEDNVSCTFCIHSSLIAFRIKIIQFKAIKKYRKKVI